MDEEFVEHHAPALICFFRGLLREDVEELVQETFLRMLEGQDRIRSGGNPGAYLFGIAWNVLRTHLRRLSRDRMVDPEIESMAALDPGPSTLAARRREHRMLAEALRRVPIEHQVALQLHYWNGFTMVTIAEIMGLSASGMRDRMRRARQLLEQHLAELERTTPLIVSSTGGD